MGYIHSSQKHCGKATQFAFKVCKVRKCKLHHSVMELCHCCLELARFLNRRTNFDPIFNILFNYSAQYINILLPFLNVYIQVFFFWCLGDLGGEMCGYNSHLICNISGLFFWFIMDVSHAF